MSATVALCFLDLSQGPKAVDAARQSLRVVQSTPLRRNQFAAHVRLGRALAAAGDLDEAVAVGGDALTLLPEVNSPRIGARLKQLRQDLVSRGAAGAVEFSERYEAVTT
ncbi:hypothetical protein AMK26_00195 [Streptomyces sp. CB03234]|nr:hypothetical protein AMK26_00195 [Streptomyces sp. CB03234]